MLREVSEPSCIRLEFETAFSVLLGGCTFWKSIRGKIRFEVLPGRKCLGVLGVSGAGFVVCSQETAGYYEKNSQHGAEALFKSRRPGYVRSMTSTDPVPKMLGLTCTRQQWPLYRSVSSSSSSEMVSKQVRVVR